MRTFDNEKGHKLLQAIYRIESRGGTGGFRELQRETGFPFNTLVRWLARLRDIGKVTRNPTFPIRLTKNTKLSIERDGKCMLIVDHRRRQRHIRNPDRRIIRGREFAIKKKRFGNYKNMAIFMILLNAVNNPSGVIRYRKLDTKFTSYGFDTLTLSIPPILRVSSYNSELQEETLVIDNPTFRGIIIHLSQLLELLLNRMQVVWTYRRPSEDEVRWFDFFYDKEMKNKKFTDFYNSRIHKDKNKIANQKYKLKISHYDRLIRQAWNDIEKRCSYLSKRSDIYGETFNLMTDMVYPKFLAKEVKDKIRLKSDSEVIPVT